MAARDGEETIIAHPAGDEPARYVCKRAAVRRWPDDAQEKSACYEPSAINFHLGETPPRELWEREPTEFAARPRHAPPRSYLFPSRRELGEAADHRALWIRERIDHGEMVHPGDGLVTGLRTGNRRKRTRAARCEEVDPTLMT